jgi:hypothetical protein
MNIGKTQAFSATAKNATGGAVPASTFNSWLPAAPRQPLNAPAPLSIAGNGNACAGTWDPPSPFAVPALPESPPCTAVSQRRLAAHPPPSTSTSTSTALQISLLPPRPAAAQCMTVSPRDRHWLFQATPSAAIPVDITDTVGPMNWSSSNSGVVTATPYVPPNQSTVLNQVQVTAKTPGITQLVASVSGTSSAPYEYTTCLIQAIYLQIGGQARRETRSPSTTAPAFRSRLPPSTPLYKFTGVPLPTPPLTWSTTNPDVAAFGTTTNTTGSNTAIARNNSWRRHPHRLLRLPQPATSGCRGDPSNPSQVGSQPPDLCQRWASAQQDAGLWSDFRRRRPVLHR